jgi:hypothetical protein
MTTNTPHTAQSSECEFRVGWSVIRYSGWRRPGNAEIVPITTNSLDGRMTCLVRDAPMIRHFPPWSASHFAWIFPVSKQPGLPASMNENNGFVTLKRIAADHISQ